MTLELDATLHAASAALLAIVAIVLLVVHLALVYHRPRRGARTSVILCASGLLALALHTVASIAGLEVASDISLIVGAPLVGWGVLVGTRRERVGQVVPT